jgi:hypothetical protein
VDGGSNNSDIQCLARYYFSACKLYVLMLCCAVLCCAAVPCCAALSVTAG